MTVDISNEYEFTIRKIVIGGYRLAGLLAAGQEPTVVQMTEGVDALQQIVAELDAEGVRLRQVRYDNLTLTAGDEFVTLPSDVFDVGPTAMFIDPDETDVNHAQVEIPVRRVYREIIHTIGSKNTRSRTPSEFRLDKELLPYRLELWPLPESGGTLRVESIRLAGDSRDGNKTPDLERHWARTLMNGVGEILATGGGVSMERIALLRSRFLSGREMHMGKEKDVVSHQARLCHPTPWSR